MSLFQIIVLVLSGLTLLGSIIGVYLKLRTDIVKLEIQVFSIQKELDHKSLDIDNLEKVNREDHNIIMGKLDRLIEKLL